MTTITQYMQALLLSSSRDHFFSGIHLMYGIALNLYDGIGIRIWVFQAIATSLAHDQPPFCFPVSAMY